MALYMNGEGISLSSGIPIKNEVNEGTPSNISGLIKGNGSTLQAAQAGVDYMVLPTTATTLPASGTALTANTIYTVTDAVGTYVFTPPTSGWAHGTFSTTADGVVSFSGQFLGDVPAIEPESDYEFDVYNGVWVVQAVVSA